VRDLNGLTALRAAEKRRSPTCDQSGLRHLHCRPLISGVANASWAAGAIGGEAAGGANKSSLKPEGHYSRAGSWERSRGFGRSSWCGGQPTTTQLAGAGGRRAHHRMRHRKGVAAAAGNYSRLARSPTGD